MAFGPWAEVEDGFAVRIFHCVVADSFIDYFSGFLGSGYPLGLYFPFVVLLTVVRFMRLRRSVGVLDSSHSDNSKY